MEKGDLDFREAGACRGRDPDIFYPQRGQANTLAVGICAQCPVVAACLEWALHHERLGIWGGTSERQRKQIRRQRAIRIETPQTLVEPVCGTTGGAQAHYRNGEAPCEASRVAKNAYNAARKKPRRPMPPPMEDGMVYAARWREAHT